MVFFHIVGTEGFCKKLYSYSIFCNFRNYYLPKLITEKICQFCDIDLILNLYESLSPSKRTVFPLHLMKKYVSDIHCSVKELREINKNVRIKELGLFLRIFYAEVNTWEF